MATTDLFFFISDLGTTTAVPGTSVTYTITVFTPGTSDAVTGASVFVPLPAGVTAASWNFAGSLNGSVSGPASGTGALLTTVDLSPSGVIDFTFTVQVDPSATGALVTTGTITPPAGTTDPNPANNTFSDTDTLTPQADLAITKTDGVTTVVPGTSDTYAIVVSNAGPSAVTGASVLDPLPPGITAATWTATGSTGGGIVSGPASGSGGLATTVDLPVNASVTFSFTAQVDPSATGFLINNALISPPAGTTDTNPTNDAAADADTLLATPTLTSAASPNVPLSEPSVTLSDSATLSGGSNPTGDIVFTLTEPGGSTFTETVTVNGNGTYTIPPASRCPPPGRLPAHIPGQPSTTAMRTTPPQMRPLRKRWFLPLLLLSARPPRREVPLARP